MHVKRNTAKLICHLFLFLNNCDNHRNAWNKKRLSVISQNCSVTQWEFCINMIKNPKDLSCECSRRKLIGPRVFYTFYWYFLTVTDDYHVSLKSSLSTCTFSLLLLIISYVKEVIYIYIYIYIYIHTHIFFLIIPYDYHVIKKILSTFYLYFLTAPAYCQLIKQSSILEASD